MPGAFDLLESFVSARNQRFVCSLAGPFEADRRQTFPVVHYLRPPASADLLRDIEECPAASQVLDFYHFCDGGLLFLDPEADGVGLELLRSSTWQLLGAAIRDSFRECDAQARPEWLDHFLAFGEVGHSGNYFVLPTAGPQAGNVVYVDHEGPFVSVWAPNFESFFEQIREDPVDQLYRMGCFLRFHRDNEQWIPERYFSGDDIVW